jgi:phenylalanyl-tRNA synthetase beta chain
MKISYQWLRQFVDVSVDPHQLADDLSMIGLPVESIETQGDDVVVELEVTANRGDCLSQWGTARELATLYRLPLKTPPIELIESSAPVSQSASVEIIDPDLCHRYCARVLTGVNVGPSPDWLVKRIESVGQRSINNVADVTNYVLFELGHPLHAFDLDHLAEHRIIVRRAKSGERLTTLDGIERALLGEHLMIADATRSVALAGIMGGLESEISLSTRNVLIESAWFLPTSIRKTARHFGLHTEASHRFERGTDVDNVVTAMNRCAQLIRQVAGGQIQKGFIDCYPTQITPPRILLRQGQLKRHLGIEIESSDIERILESLQFKRLANHADGTLWLTPTWRNDITREIDLIEEIARHYGYDKFPPRMPRASTRGFNLPSAQPVSRIKERLRSLGYYEIISFPFLDAQEGARYTDLKPVELSNPLSEVAAAMQATAVPALLEMVRRNIHRGQHDVRLFEVAKAYYRDSDERPVEQPVVVFGGSGHLHDKGVHEDARLYDFFAFKGDVEAVLSLFEIPAGSFTRAENRFHVYHGEQSSDYIAEGQKLATFGLVDASILDRFKIKQEVFVAELDLALLLGKGLRRIQFKTLSAFPAAERDLSFILPLAVTYESIAKTVSEARVANLVGIRPLDRYQHKSLGEGQYSFALRLIFQSSERTLVEQEVNAEVERVIQALETRLGAKIRKAP